MTAKRRPRAPHPAGRMLDGRMLAAALLVLGAAPLARAAPAPARVQKTTAGGPQLAYERFRREVQVEVAEKREEQIEGLLRLLELGAPPEEKPDLEFRLAELYADKSRFYFFRSQEKTDAIARAESEEAKVALREAQREEDELSKLWARKALEVYARIRRAHPDYARMPEVLFALGQSHWTRGEYAKALKPYEDLIRQYPDSPLVSEAWIAFGEFFFNGTEDVDADVIKALKSYQKAAEDTRSRVYGFALYKQGWCYYNMAEWRKALEKFEATVLYSQLSEEMSGENKIALGREAQADWVRTYVHIGTPRDARFEIARLLDVERCEGRCLVLLEDLANRWFGEGYFAEAADLYRQLVRLEPESLRNPLRQGRVVDIADRRGNKPKTIEEAEALVEIFLATRARFEALPEGSEARKNAAGDIQEAEIVAENTFRRLAQEWNREGRKTHQDGTLERAERMYGFYLRLFPEAKPAYDMRFQYADLLYELERFDEAAKLYRAVVEARPEDGEHLVEAAHDNILAVEEHLRDLEEVELPTDLEARAELHPQHQRLVDATERYLTLVPEEASREKRPAVELKAARIFYAYNHYPEALRRFEAIVKAHPRSEQAVVAANLVADIHNLEEDWADLYAAARRYLDDPDLMKGRPELRQALAKYGQYAKFALVQALEARVKDEGGALREVARGYEDFYREFPRSENADEALFNASVLWDREGEKARAAELRGRLLEAYPESPLRADVAHYAAKRHQERTEYAEAARALAAFAREFPDDARAKDALYDASVFYAGMGRARRAARLRERYLETYGRARGAKDEVEALRYAIAVDLDRARRYRQAERAYAGFAKKHPLTARAFDAMWRRAEILEDELRRRRAAEKVKRRLLGTVRWMEKKGREVPPNALRHASLVAFELLDDDFRDYARMRLRAPSLRNPRPFLRSLRKKARARDRMIARYTKIVKTYRQVESSIASLYRIARAWDVFADDLTSLPCPRGVSREVCEQLQAKLEERSAPARESALAGYRACVERSNELETFTPFSTRCAKRLEKLAPELAPPLLEKILEPASPPGPAPMDPHLLILDDGGRADGARAKTASREVAR